MLTEDYIVRMIRDMGQMLARVLGSQAWEPDRCAEVWEAAAGDCPHFRAAEVWAVPCWRS